MPPIQTLLVIAVAVCAAIACASLAGCGRSGLPSKPAATIEQIIRDSSDAPIAKSIKIVAPPLSTHEVVVPIEDNLSSGQITTTEPTTLHIKAAKDNQGHIWAYAYTSDAEFSRAFPGGGRFVKMAFSNFFDIIEPDDKFRGISLNAGSDSFYPIPRELFESVRQMLPDPANEATAD